MLNAQFSTFFYDVLHCGYDLMERRLRWLSLYTYIGSLDDPKLFIPDLVEDENTGGAVSRKCILKAQMKNHAVSFNHAMAVFV